MHSLYLKGCTTDWSWDSFEHSRSPKLLTLINIYNNPICTRKNNFILTPQPQLRTFHHGPRSLCYSLRALVSTSFTSTTWTNQHISSNFVTKVFLRTRYFGYAARSLRVLRRNQSMGTIARLWPDYHRIWVRTPRRDSETTLRSHCLGRHPRPVSIYLVRCCFHFLLLFFPTFF